MKLGATSSVELQLLQVKQLHGYSAGIEGTVESSGLLVTAPRLARGWPNLGETYRDDATELKVTEETLRESWKVAVIWC